MAEYRGKSVSKGYAFGKVYLFSNESLKIHHDTIKKEDFDAEYKRFADAKVQGRRELEQIRDRLSEKMDDKAQIMEAHLSILNDFAIEEEISLKIKEESYNALWAVETVFGKYIRIMERAKDEMFRARAADFRDIRDRVLYNMAGIDRKRLDMIPEPCIVVCHELMPSDTAGMDRTKVLGIVAEVGSDTSHSAILARSYEIPALLGVPDITALLCDEQEIIVDAVQGRILTDVNTECKNEYLAKAREYQKQLEDTKRYLCKEPVSLDGERPQIMLNVGSPEHMDNVRCDCVDGVGLFRTEFLYMENDHMPTEEEQFEAYKKMLELFGEKPVVLRTLDIGGDKALSYLQLPKEDNPFLGERALRFCFSHPEVLRPQLRAAYRASVYGNLWIMFPMVSSIEDIRKAKQAVSDVKAGLKKEGITYRDDVKVGVMIEIPALALIADKVAAEVDFASIGSNDLIQYTMAVDRMNPSIAEYYQNVNPAVFRLIRYAVKAFDEANKPISLCGELGGNPLTALLLLGTGMRKLSMNYTSVPAVKKLICQLDCRKAKDVAERALDLDTQQDIIRLVEQEFPVWG